MLTDYTPYLTEYSERYPGNIIATQCNRTDSNIGVHYLTQHEKVKNGIEVMKDAFLAGGCKYFIGNGWSNVSTSILHMKDWDEDYYTLLHNNMLYGSNFLLHNW